MTKSELQELKQGDCITTKYGSIILVHHVEIKENGVYIYYFFDYDQKYKLFNGNYSLNGFFFMGQSLMIASIEFLLQKRKI